ncbi:hypothetical protein J1N35_041863 [Gossypium stocksii]|uniref:MULE transposase domain-containing protein n=1 Tax=Gossypium stocksii TaxID=47602 RepID=A0A9D3ZJ12_9ROSI|nr:hypothetical protein J1N35_041863 [Gossypium stocksii]
MDSIEDSGFDVEQNTLGGDFGGEASDSNDSSYKAYELDTSYSDSFESDGDRIDGSEVELIGDDFDSNSDRYLNNNVGYDEDGNKKYVLFNPQTDIRNPILIKGLVFPSRDILKDAVKQYGRINRVVTKLTRNDKLRVKVVCVPSCPWTLWASKLNPKDPIDGSWQIKTLINHHKCGKLTGCSGIIRLDGYWLKGYYGGHLFATVGVDANDCIYPVAFAVVESENKHSWFWFLELLQKDLEIENSYNICFMSDKQKGLIEVISMLFPNSKARNYAIHLYNNFKNMERFRGQAMRLTYWKAAKATFPRQFEEVISEMRSLSESVEAWLRGKDLRTWSRAHFSTRCKSDRY